MPEQSSLSQSDPSWQQAVFAELRAAKDWLRGGDVFDAVESGIPLHHAMRHCERHTRSKERSPSGARWKLFLFATSQMGVVWERAARNHQPSDRLKLKVFGKCSACGDDLRKISWTTKTTVECKGCGIAVDMPGYEKMSPMKKEPAVVIASKEPVSQHSLIGYRVTKRDERGAIEMRNGTIVDVVVTNHMGFGDIAVIAYRDRSRVDLVSLAELSAKRELWVIMPAGNDIAEAADD